jgi:hypothetical protein
LDREWIPELGKGKYPIQQEDPGVENEEMQRKKKRRRKRIKKRKGYIKRIEEPI